MPHVEIKCFPGRSEEQKRNCAEKISEIIAET
ncbi:MAG: tautomerase family protein, partial [Treponema sp.]|nr:tautomerase family protein [Treponema sp.]